MVVKVKDIEAGQYFGDDRLWYKTIGPLIPNGIDSLLSVEIQWADGGIGWRHWDLEDREIELPIWEGYVPEFLRG